MAEKIHLKGLNGLRALAAMAVVISHINLLLDNIGLPKAGALPLANFGVTIFFALSGFLITYLLLHEKTRMHTIDVKKFYIRRALRIWPLYFLYLGVAMTVCGWTMYADVLYYYLFFIPNVAFVIGVAIPLLKHYWSLGVEEQFYLFWPLLMRYVSNILRCLIWFVVVFFALKVLVKYSASNEVYALLHYSRFGCMAIGAIGAWFYFYQKEKINFLHAYWIQAIAWATLLMIALNKFYVFSIIDHEIVAVITVILIYNQAEGRSFINLNTRVPNYLGGISFGMYVYNPLVIFAFESLLKDQMLAPSVFNYCLIYIFIILIVVLVSHISYRFFEKRFLHVKERYMVVPSKG
jgi:peptidoglycan/LPS O-acetylase OafA/YrhL